MGRGAPAGTTAARYGELAASPVTAPIRSLPPVTLWQHWRIWSGGEAVIRFQPGPIFSGNPSDYWAPLNWLDLDNRDLDLGGSGPLLVDVPGATPSSSGGCTG